MLDDRAGTATMMGQKLSPKTHTIVLLRKIVNGNAFQQRPSAAAALICANPSQAFIRLFAPG
jgi:hypothetical protein